MLTSRWAQRGSITDPVAAPAVGAFMAGGSGYWGSYSSQSTIVMKAGVCLPTYALTTLYSM